MTLMAVKPEGLRLPHGREWTVKDLEKLPDDGLRYELFDGVLVVRPAPVPGHQRCIAALYRLLYAACPPEWEVFFAPLDFQPSDKRSFEPDLLVVRRDRVGHKNVVHPPVLNVEVLSPSTRTKDLVWKRDIYASSGVAHYWTFDPAGQTGKPEFVAYQLDGETYHEVARAIGDQNVAVTSPYAVEVCPDTIVAG